MACEEIIGILNDLEDMVKRLTIETTFDAFINLGNPSKALQELAVTLSKVKKFNNHSVSNKVNAQREHNRNV